MKALTLTQPWATAVAIGVKQIETRSWSTTYRGPLAIHAAKGWTAADREFAQTERTLGRIPPRIPLGAVIATCELYDVCPAEEIGLLASAIERLYGDYSPGRFAWMLTNVHPLPEPVPARGSLGLWEWDG